MQNAEGKPLAGKVAVVVGATRHAGRGIAIELGAAGAIVYCTGRSVRGEPSPSNRPETIDETAEMVTAHGGVGIAAKVDHTDEDQVKALFEQISVEQDDRLDILVNDIFNANQDLDSMSWARGKPFWETNLQSGLRLLEQAVHTHIITNHWGVPMMAARNSGLIVEIGDGISYRYRGVNHGMFYYSLCKINVIHLAEAMAADLQHKGLDGITAVALTPGYLRSETILGEITEEQWQEKRSREEQDQGLPEKSDAGCESTRYIGRAVVALATDPNVHVKSGLPLSTSGLMKEYGFTDIDGRQPNWNWDAM